MILIRERKWKEEQQLLEDQYKKLMIEPHYSSPEYLTINCTVRRNTLK